MKRILSTLIFALLALGWLNAQTFNTGATGAIPDATCDATNEFDLDLTGSGLANIDAVFGFETLCLDISHSWVSDLDISLRAPDGTEVELSTDNGGSGDDYTGTCFNMSGVDGNITAATAPFTGTYVPEGNLGTFNNGQDPNGVWTLIICDDASGDTGTLNSWEITFGNNPAPPPVPLANDDCANAIALTVGANETCTNTAGDNSTATASGETPNPTCSSFGTGEDMWYSIVVPAGGDVTVQMNANGGPTDWGMSIYSGACGSLTQVECDDDDGPGLFPQIDLTGQTPGETLLIRVFEFGNNATGGFNICAFEPLVPLPVELTAFTGEAMEKTNQLYWETASEENTQWHIIERSVDGRDSWEVVGQTAAVGFSTTAQQYKMEDTQPLSMAYYRLRSVDFDGSEMISDIITVERERISDEVVAVQPNPTQGEVTITFDLAEAGKYRLLLTDVNGRIVQDTEVSFKRWGTIAYPQSGGLFQWLILPQH